MSEEPKSVLFPSPSEFSYLEGSFEKPKSIRVNFEDDSYESLISVAPIPLVKSTKYSANLNYVQNEKEKPEAIKIICSPSGFTVFSSTAKAGLTALHSLRQILNSREINFNVSSSKTFHA